MSCDERDALLLMINPDVSEQASEAANGISEENEGNEKEREIKKKSVN